MIEFHVVTPGIGLEGGRTTGAGYTIIWGDGSTARATPAGVLEAVIGRLQVERLHRPDSVADDTIGRLRAAKAELEGPPTGAAESIPPIPADPSSE